MASARHHASLHVRHHVQLVTRLARSLSNINFTADMQKNKLEVVTSFSYDFEFVLSNEIVC